MTYGLPKGTRITYGTKGFPDWVYRIGLVPDACDPIHQLFVLKQRLRNP